jgi:hypothetical protein
MAERSVIDPEGGYGGLESLPEVIVLEASEDPPALARSLARSSIFT